MLIFILLDSASVSTEYIKAMCPSPLFLQMSTTDNIFPSQIVTLDGTNENPWERRMHISQ